MRCIKTYFGLFAGVVAMLMVVSCSTTRRIPDDEMLYTGVKGVKVAESDSGAVPSAMV